MAGSPIPATGDGWNTAIPDNQQPHGNDYNEHRETKLAVAARIGKEHTAFGASGAGAEHKAGSAVIYVGDYSTSAAGDNLPTLRPDGSTALDSNDAGRLAYDTDATYGGLFYKWSGSAWEQIPLVALTGAQTIAGVKTFSSFPVTPSSAPTTDYQIANKKYVDDHVTAYAVIYSGTEVFADAAAPQSYTDLDLSAVVGANRALVHLKVKNTSGSSRTFVFRTNGESDEVGYSTPDPESGATCAAYIRPGYIGYFTVLTDASGIIEWKAAGTTNASVNLLTYQKCQ